MYSRTTTRRIRGLIKTRPRRFEPLLFLSILISDGNQRRGLIATDKKKARNDAFPDGALQLPSGRERSPIGMHDRRRWTSEAVPDTAPVTLFCLVNRIFAHPCACLAIRDDPRAASARESMHIADFQNDITAFFVRDIQFYPVLYAYIYQYSLQQFFNKLKMVKILKSENMWIYSWRNDSNSTRIFL